MKRKSPSKPSDISVSSCNPSTAAAAQPLLPHPKGLQSFLSKRATVSTEKKPFFVSSERSSAELALLERTHGSQVKKRVFQSSISSILCKRSCAAPTAEEESLEETCAPQFNKRAIQSGIMDFITVPGKKQAAQDRSLAKSIESKAFQTFSKVEPNKCTVVGKPSDFFKPSSEKQQRVLMDKLAMKCSRKPEVKEKVSVTVDLQMEAWLAAEENAQLFAGKPTHPFFSHQNVRQQAFPCDSNIGCAFSAPIVSSEYLSPSPPCHINQLSESTACKIECVTWKGKLVWSERRKDQHVLTTGLPVQELGMLLRIAPFSGSKLTSASKSVSQLTTEEISLEPLESTSVKHLETFLKDLEKGNKLKDEEEEDDFVFTEGGFKERLKLFQSGLAKNSGSTSTNLLWTDVYQPYLLEQVFGNTESVKSLSMWLQSWQSRSMPSFDSPEEDVYSQRTTSSEDNSVEDSVSSADDSDCGGNLSGSSPPNVLVLMGPVGCGKTVTIYACARLHGYTIIEVNCSENRGGPLIKQKFGESVESHHLGNRSADSNFVKEQGEDNKSGNNKDKAILLLEDVDVLFHIDHGFMAAVAQVAATAKRPIVLTTNACNFCIPHNLHARLLEFKRLSTKDLVALAHLVCIAEGFALSPQLLERLVKACNHDTRKLLNFLQFWCQKNNQSKLGLTIFRRGAVKITKDEGNKSEAPSSVKLQEGDPAAVTILLCYEAQHRLWPVYMSTECQCDVTKLVANKLAELICKIDRNIGVYQEKKLVQSLVRKRVLLHRRERRRIDSNSDIEAGLSSDDDDKKNFHDSGGGRSNSPVDDVFGVRNIAPLPVARKRLLAVVMSDSDDDLPCTAQRQHFLEGCHSPINQEPLRLATSRTTTSQSGLSVEPLTLSADAKSDKSSKSQTWICPLKDLESSQFEPIDFQSISEAVDNWWSNFRNGSKDVDGLLLNAASKDSLSSVNSLSVLSDNLSACDIMLYKQCCAQGQTTDVFKCVCENPDCSNRLNVCAQIAHKTFQMCLHDSCMVLNCVGEIEDANSVEDMLLAVDDPFTLGKLAANGYYHHNTLGRAAPASGEVDRQRLGRRFSLQHSLSAELQPRAHRFFQGASFYEWVSYLALIQKLKQDESALGPQRQRTRFCQSHQYPWNLSQNLLNILQGFGSFGRHLEP